MTLNFFSNFKFYFDCTKGIFYKIKINSHGFYVVKKKVVRRFSPSLIRGDLPLLPHMSTVAN